MATPEIVFSNKMIVELNSPTNKFFLSTNGSYSTINTVPDYSVMSEDKDNNDRTGEELQLNMKIPVTTELASVNRASLYVFLEYNYSDE